MVNAYHFAYACQATQDIMHSTNNETNGITDLPAQAWIINLPVRSPNALVK